MNFLVSAFLIFSFAVEASSGPIYVDRMAVSPGGELYLFSLPFTKVCAFSRSGELLQEFGALGTDPGELWTPTDIFVAGDGKVFISDSTNMTISVFSASGDFLRSWPTIDGQFQIASTALVGNESHLFAPGWLRMLIYDYDGNLVDSFPSHTGDNIWVEDMAIGPNGEVVVLHGLNSVDPVVSIFSSDGERLTGFGDRGGYPGEFATRPNAITVDNQGRIVIAESLRDKIQMFDMTGDYLGEASVPGPHSLAFYKDRLYVGSTHYIHVVDLDPETVWLPTIGR